MTQPLSDYPDRIDRHPDKLDAHTSWSRIWCLTWTALCGVFALLWLILRSGPRPNRFVYPCQQAAFSTAALAFGVPVVSAVMTARRRLSRAMRTPLGVSLAAMGLVMTAGMWGYLTWAAEYAGPEVDPPVDYRAKIYQVTDCPQDPIGERFVGVDNLINLMGREGLKLFRSETESLVSGPDGIVSSDDVVVVKINYQWDQRGGTNTDVLRGLILRLLDHPDTFSGEIVVCENAQFNSINNFDRPNNNAQVRSQSPHDVVVGFQQQGYPVSHYDWTVSRNTLVGEYSQGNMTDGYIVYPYNQQLFGRVSYPKFRTPAGHYVSLKYGIWDTESETYDRDKLKFINVPVLKSHHATYGATACVKNYMGVVTGNLNTNSHSAINYGILGAQLAEIQLADLNILDSIWINANPNDGPWTTYGGATRRDRLLASVDPVATDIWAVKNILIPAFIERGYSPPWPFLSADPDIPNSRFRLYLDRSMNYILAAGFTVTNDLESIDVTTWNGDGDADGDSDVDSSDFAGFVGCVGGPGSAVSPACDIFDFDGDGDVDMHDLAGVQRAYTGPGIF